MLSFLKAYIDLPTRPLFHTGYIVLYFVFPKFIIKMHIKYCIWYYNAISVVHKKSVTGVTVEVGYLGYHLMPIALSMAIRFSDSMPFL